MLWAATEADKLLRFFPEDYSPSHIQVLKIIEKIEFQRNLLQVALSIWAKGRLTKSVKPIRIYLSIFHKIYEHSLMLISQGIGYEKTDVFEISTVKADKLDRITPNWNYLAKFLFH